MAKKTKPVEVVQDPVKPVGPKVLAQAIVDIGKAARALAASGLNQKGLKPHPNGAGYGYVPSGGEKS